MRVPWGEGNGSGGVGARGSCQGGGPSTGSGRTGVGSAPALDPRFRGNDDGGVGARGSCQGGGCTAPRSCPGFPLSRERRWGSWREGLVSGWGMHRPAPLPWIPAFAGTTMGELARGARVRVGDAPPRAPALDSRFRGNDDGGVGARGSCQGGGCTAPRPCPGFPLSRERRWGSWREGLVSGWGMHRPAPLPWIPAFAGTTMGECARGSCQGGGCTAPRPCPGFPLSRERRWGRWREGFVSGWGMHRPAPLPWIPAFRGNDDGGMRIREGRLPWRCGEWGREGRPEDGPFESLRTGSGRTDLGSARHAMGFERSSGLWHHCQGSVVGVWVSTLYAREGGGRTTAS